MFEKDHATKKDKNADRNSNIELLRIIAMVMIVMYHQSLYGDFGKLSYYNQGWILFTSMGGKIGVDIFVIITGYYSITKIKFSYKKILMLILKMTLWSILIQYIYMRSNNVNILKSEGIKSLILAVIPFFSDKWWFMTVYILLLLISPYLNIVLNLLEKKEYLLMCCGGIFFCYVIPTATLGKLGYAKYTDPVMLFVILYAIGGYLSRFSKDIKKYLSGILLCTAIILLVYFISVIVLIRFRSFLVEESSSMFCLAIAIGIFIFFQSIPIHKRNWINAIARNTLDIYLFSEHELVRINLWMYVGAYLSTLGHSIAFIPAFCGMTLIVMIIGIVIGHVVDIISNCVIIGNR